LDLTKAKVKGFKTKREEINSAEAKELKLRYGFRIKSSSKLNERGTISLPNP
jgi:hypothetical protein